MIRIPAPCPTELLSGLLDDTLGAEDEAFIYRHLDDCETCRGKLRTLAADEQLWQDTRCLLDPRGYEHLHIADRERSERPGVSPDAAASRRSDDLQWLIPHLKPSGAPGSLGRLDEYEVHDLIGWGGMGVVLRAVDTKLSRTVALKLLHPHLAASGPARKRFTREARAAAAINHPSVVPIHSVESDHTPPYLVMTYIPGGSLQDRIDAEGNLELEKALRIAVQIAEGLAAAHAQCVVHRDVKPANILLDHGQDRVLLGDFGLAQALDDASQTCSGLMAGTPQYMIPEQAAGRGIDARSDLFSLGSVLYTMLAGRPPYRGENTLSVLKRIESESPTRIDIVQPQTPAWVQELLNLLHARDARDRLPTAEAAARVLRECLAHVTAPTQHPLPGRLQPRTLLRPSKRPNWQIIRVALGMAFAGLLVAAMWPLTSHTVLPNRPSPNPTMEPATQSPAPATSPNTSSKMLSLDEPQRSSTPDLSDTRWDDGMDDQVNDLRRRLDRLRFELF